MIIASLTKEMPGNVMEINRMHTQTEFSTGKKERLNQR
jgi:hypothetical protein